MNELKVGMKVLMIGRSGTTYFGTVAWTHGTTVTLQNGNLTNASRALSDNSGASQVGVIQFKSVVVNDWEAWCEALAN